MTIGGPAPYIGVNAASTSLDAPGSRCPPGFAEVAAEQLDAVYRYLVYLTGDRSAAEDLTAETFEKAFRTWRRFDPRRGSPRTWLCRIARSVAIDWFRAETRRRRREETYARDARRRRASSATACPARSRRRCGSCRRRSARWWRYASCSSSTARAPRACSGSARPRARRGLSRALRRLEERMNDVRE